MKNQWGVLAAVCALVVGVYAYTARSDFWDSVSRNAADNSYNLLVRGFQAGQLSLKKDVPPGLAQLTDPYDPTANKPYRLGTDRLLDLSYYKGKLYLYWGITPALILFWPYAVLTVHYLSHRVAVLVFCATGFLASVGLLRAVWRRYFPGVSIWVVAAGALALGLATGVPAMLPRSSVYEVAISCGYGLTMLALVAIWKALHEPERRSRWLAAASLAYGLAVGARPSLLFGAPILLAPVAQAWRERRRVGTLLLAATVPVTLVGLGLMLYNALRFNNPFEFGQHFQLAGERQVTLRFFGLDYLWFNFRVYFLEPARWSCRFPFVHDSAVPPLPLGHGRVEHTFGVLTSIPLVWLASALPLAWRGRSADARSTLRGFLAAVAALFGIITLTLSLYFGACSRYEVEFLSPLVLLAVIGVLSVERALTPITKSGPGWHPVWRRAMRCGWTLLMVFSVAFNLLASVEYCAYLYIYDGASLQQLGKMSEAIERFQHALRIDPDSAEAHFYLGNALLQEGKLSDAIRHYEQALQIRPDYADAHCNLGVALAQSGRIPEAIQHLEHALRIKPDSAEAHYNLGNVLLQKGKVSDAIAHYEQALRNNPDYAGAHYKLGLALVRQGRPQEAIGHWEQAVRINPDFADAQYILGLALEKLGRTPEAIEHYQQALKLRPDLTPAKDALTRLRTGP